MGEWVLLERGHQRGVPPKRRYFAVIGSYSVKTVADRYIHAAYITSTGDRLLRFINIDDDDGSGYTLKYIILQFGLLNNTANLCPDMIIFSL